MEIDTSKCKDNFAKVEYIYTENGDCQMQHFRKFCKDTPIDDCYYKQLQQLKEENEELKEKLKKCGNENLNEIYELIKKNDCWRGIVNVVNERLEQKLEKIEEIVKATQKDLCNNCGWHNTDGCDTEDNICGEFKRILQIIRGEE